MEQTVAGAQSANFNDDLSLMPWLRERTRSELMSFIERRHEALPATIEVE